MINLQAEAKTWQERLQGEVQTANEKLQQLINQQAEIKSPEKLAVSILEYEKLESEISDRGYVLTLLMQPLDRMITDYFKSELFSYFDAAETVSEELTDFIVSAFHELSKEQAFKDYEDSDDYINHYKEYVLPGKILAHRFAELDDLVKEMNEYLVRRDPNYDHQLSAEILFYAFKMSLSGNIDLESLIEGIKGQEYEYLTAAHKSRLYAEIEEELGVKRFETARKQQLAMDKALKMLELKEQSKK